MGDFVADYEFDILGDVGGYFSSKFIAHEEPILDFDGTEDNFVIGIMFLSLHLLYSSNMRRKKMGITKFMNL